MLIDQPISSLIRFRLPVLPEIWRSFCFYGGWKEAWRRRPDIFYKTASDVGGHFPHLWPLRSAALMQLHRRQSPSSTASSDMSPSSLTHSSPRSSCRGKNKANSEATLTILPDIRLRRWNNAKFRAFDTCFFIFRDFTVGIFSKYMFVLVYVTKSKVNYCGPTIRSKYQFQQSRLYYRI